MYVILASLRVVAIRSWIFSRRGFHVVQPHWNFTVECCASCKAACNFCTCRELTALYHHAACFAKRNRAERKKRPRLSAPGGKRDAKRMTQKTQVQRQSRPRLSPGRRRKRCAQEGGRKKMNDGLVVEKTGYEPKPFRPPLIPRKE